MNRWKSFLNAMIVLTSVLNYASAQLPDEIRRHFDEHLVGQWTTDSDFGGVKQTGSEVITWNDGGQSLSNRWTITDENGVTQVSELIGWDAATNNIVVQGFDSHGNTWTIHWDRPSGSAKKWTGRGVGTFEGKRWETPATMQFTKDAYRYEDTTGGKPYILNAKRRGESDQPHLAWLKYLAGRWEFDLGDGRAGTVTYASAGATPALAFRGEANDFSIAGVIGWRADSQTLVETDFHTEHAGVSGSLDREYSHITRDSLKGWGKFQDSSKAAGSQAMEWRRINDNEMTLTGSGGTGTDWIVKFKRTK